MAIEAALSKFKKNNLKIFIVILIGLGIWFAYDGYKNEEFIEKHTNEDGTMDSTLAFNKKSPPYFIAAGVLCGVYLFLIKDRKIIADESGLVINDKLKIPYDSIQQINKTHFDSKGHFTITYKNESGKDINCKISDRMYDNLSAVVDEIVGKIS
jgi:hypothetical protein